MKITINDEMSFQVPAHLQDAVKKLIVEIMFEKPIKEKEITNRGTRRIRRSFPRQVWLATEVGLLKDTYSRYSDTMSVTSFAKKHNPFPMRPSTSVASKLYEVLAKEPVKKSIW